MMYLLGGLDLLAAGVLAFEVFRIHVAVWLMAGLAGYLVIKILAFPFIWASLIDLFAALLLFAGIFANFPLEFPLAVAGFLALKGTQSFFPWSIF